jgi:hypothetical protein
VTVRVNGEAHEWTDLLKGKTFDYLPRELNIVIEGATPKGRRYTRTVTLPFHDPRVEPLK